jgi:hypothetical protein
LRISSASADGLDGWRVRKSSATGVARFQWLVFREHGFVMVSANLGSGNPAREWGRIAWIQVLPEK